MYVYLDNAATSRFKPRGVFEALAKDLASSANGGRSAHRDALRASLKIENCRRFLLDAFGAGDERCLVFTKSCTEALNLALFGLIKGGERVITTANEHNAVLRPLYELKRRGLIDLKIISPTQDGRIDERDIISAATCGDIFVGGGVSNVTGASYDIAGVAKKIKGFGCKIIMDGAQSVPLADLNLKELGIDMLACPGHKGLHGVQGTGFLIVDKSISLKPLIFGGTGSASKDESMPEDMPESLEAGTQFTGGIDALREGAKWSLEHIKETRQNFHQLAKTAVYNLKSAGYTVYCENCDSGIIAFNFEDADSGTAADMFDEKGVALRSGLHCAPLVHKHFGTLSQGMLRASLGVETTARDIAYFCSAAERVAKRLKNLR